MTSHASFDGNEIHRARYTIYINAACCAGWAVINVAAAWLLGNSRLFGLSAAALGMIVSWTIALRDLGRGRVMRGVLNYVVSGLLLLLAMGLFVPEMSVLFVFATFIFLAYGLSYADTTASALIVALTVIVAATLLFTSLVLRLTSGVNPELLRWVNVTGMTMALTINGVSFIALRKTLVGRGERLSNEAKFRALTELASDAIITANGEGTITYLNGAAQAMFGWSVPDVLGQSLTILMPERFREPHLRGLARFLSTGEARVVGRRAVDLVGIKRDGTEFPVELSLTTWRADDAPYFSAIIRDVTERHRIENDLRRAKDRAETASHELEAFSYSVAHDLRAPLRAMNGYSTALVEDFGPQLGSEAMAFLDHIKEAAMRMAQLIDALLGLSRISRTEFQRVRVDLSEMAEAVAAELRAEDPARTVDFAIARDLVVDADPQLARIVLENLLGNAWKFASKTPSPRIEFGREPSGAYYVRDNGAGFEMAYAAKLFAPFQRLHAADEFPGTGIGLATVQRVITRHGGRIWAEGAKGRGATFRFTLLAAGSSRERLLGP